MFSVIEHVKRACQELGLNYLLVGNSRLMMINSGHHGVFISHLVADEQARTLEVRTELPFTVPAGSRSAAAMALDRVNATVSIGTCAISDEHGTIVHGVGVRFSEIAPEPGKMIPLLMAGCTVLDQHFPALIAIIFGEDFVRNACSTTSCPILKQLHDNPVDPAQARRGFNRRTNRFRDQLGGQNN